MTGSQAGVAIGAAAAFVALLGLIYEIRACRSQLWLQMFSEYTRRYADITDRLPAEARRLHGQFELADIDPVRVEDLCNGARAYLNLCAEEFYLHSRRRIDRQTWEIWKTGIRETARLPWIQQTWPLLAAEYQYYPDFATFFADCVESGRR